MTRNIGYKRIGLSYKGQGMTKEVAIFFGNDYDPTNGIATAQTETMHPDNIPHIGDTYRIGPYILTCITASAKTITGRIEE